MLGFIKRYYMVMQEQQGGANLANAKVINAIIKNIPIKSYLMEDNKQLAKYKPLK